MKSITTLFIFFLLTLSGCSSLLFYPSKVKYVDDSKLEFKPKEIQIQLPEDQSTIFAWMFEPKGFRQNQKPILIFFHGNGQNLSAHFLSLYWVLEHGYAFMIFDYPGYGASSGNPTPKNAVEAGLESVKWVQSQYPDSKLVIFGQSLGGAVALTTWAEMKEKEKVCLVAIESSFLSYRSVAKSVLKRQLWTWPLQPLVYLVLSDRYAPKSHLKKMPESSYVVSHGDMDSIVDYKQGQELFKALPERKEFWNVAEGQHIGAFSGTDRLMWRNRFIKKLEQDCD